MRSCGSFLCRCRKDLRTNEKKHPPTAQRLLFAFGCRGMNLISKDDSLGDSTSALVSNLVEIGLNIVDGDFLSLISGYNQAYFGNLTVCRVLTPDIQVAQRQQPCRRYGRPVSRIH